MERPRLGSMSLSVLYQPKGQCETMKTGLEARRRCQAWWLSIWFYRPLFACRKSKQNCSLMRYGTQVALEMTHDPQPSQQSQSTECQSRRWMFFCMLNRLWNSPMITDNLKLRFFGRNCISGMLCECDTWKTSLSIVDGIGVFNPPFILW